MSPPAAPACSSERAELCAPLLPAVGLPTSRVTTDLRCPPSRIFWRSTRSREGRVGIPISRRRPPPLPQTASTI
eukprot:scaffold3678_cov355-Prasinococcus_capsulatus_cf.AAC.6